MTEPVTREEYLDQISEEYLGVVWRENPPDIKYAMSAAFEAGWGAGYVEANTERDIIEAGRDHHHADEN